MNEVTTELAVPTVNVQVLEAEAKKLPAEGEKQIVQADDSKDKPVVLN